MLGIGTLPVIGDEPLTGKAANSKSTEKPSLFEEDGSEILWFRQGEDGETKYSSSLVLSAVTDGIVITVTANEAHIADALKLATKMRTVLQKNDHTPDKISIVAWKDSLTGLGILSTLMACAWAESTNTATKVYSSLPRQRAKRRLALWLNNTGY